MPIVIIFFIFIMSLHTLALREYPPSWQDSSSPLPYFSKSLCWSLPTSLVTYGLYSYPFFFCQLLFFLLENFHLKIKKIKAFFNDIDMCVFSFALADTILETIYSNTSFEKVLQTCSRLIGKGEKSTINIKETILRYEVVDTFLPSQIIDDVISAPGLGVNEGKGEEAEERWRIHLENSCLRTSWKLFSFSNESWLRKLFNEEEADLSWTKFKASHQSCARMSSRNTGSKYPSAYGHTPTYRSYSSIPDASISGISRDLTRDLGISNAGVSAFGRNATSLLDSDFSLSSPRYFCSFLINIKNTLVIFFLIIQNLLLQCSRQYFCF